MTTAGLVNSGEAHASMAPTMKALREDNENFADLLREEMPPAQRTSHNLKGGVQVSRINEVQPVPGGVLKAKRAAKAKSLFQIEREAVAEKMQLIASQLDEIVQAAKVAGSPAHAELAVRKSYRIADGIRRKASELKTVREPGPWITAPTREREAQAGEAPRQEVVEVNEVAVGVVHRWEWPVRRAWRRHILRAHHVTAADRFRKMFDAIKSPPSMGYSMERTQSDPAKRFALTSADDQRQREGKSTAVVEFDYIRRRLEPEFFLVIWCLVLERPLPGDSQALAPVEFGKRFLGEDGDTDARKASDHALRWLCVRLCTIYRHFDTEHVRLTPEEIEKGRRLVRGERVASPP